MKWQKKIINLLENTPDQPSKFRTKYWVEINHIVLVVILSLKLIC